jgi:hypothetical protein
MDRIGRGAKAGLPAQVNAAPSVAWTTGPLDWSNRHFGL